MNNEPAPMILDEESVKGLIYEIRSQRVMLDFDLAKVYGYMTRDFNRQVKNNQERFDSDFCFRLIQEEWDGIMWWKKSTANSASKRRYLPYAFTEQGIYMLMTVLRGDLAIQQSKTLIRLFRQKGEEFAHPIVH